MDSSHQSSQRLRPPTVVPSNPILKVIQRYNDLMQNNTIGPNCADPTQCRGDCCSILIDVPRALIELYMKEGWLEAGHVRRGGPFAFRLGVADNTAKCIFFDPQINGCRVHFTGFKPPQCWIYPTGFTKGEKTCKKGYSWDIINEEKARAAEILLEEYKKFGIEDAREEVARLKADWATLRLIVAKKLKMIPPSHFLGMTWGFEGLQPLDEAGFSLQIKRICKDGLPECEKDFMECAVMCERIVDAIVNRYGSYLDLFFQGSESREFLRIRDLK
ncbi:MAG: hypothetical protein RBG13Loki_2467 [Promethearchaeota archaeon CR_4]|nr:MAG: hypothetical protein RBG13Loki_2467 [Candidatus Lokiarchaeota archaeon CR_4]